MLFDSHAHLNFEDFGEDLEGVISRAKEGGVEKIVNIGTSLKDSEEAIVLSAKRQDLYVTVGIHPNDNPSATAENIDWKKFSDLAGEPNVVAVGECGLDYSRIDFSEGKITENEEKERQRRLFEKQIDIAGQLQLPLSIHIRSAQEDLISFFGGKLKELTGVFHCFSGDRNYLEFILKKLPGFYISFAGNVTFRNAPNLQELAKSVPMDRLLIETDCPFLAPEPLRGSKNEPKNIALTAGVLAGLKSIAREELEEKTYQNAVKLFRL